MRPQAAQKFLSKNQRYQICSMLQVGTLLLPSALSLIAYHVTSLSTEWGSTVLGAFPHTAGQLIIDFDCFVLMIPSLGRHDLFPVRLEELNCLYTSLMLQINLVE